VLAMAIIFLPVQEWTMVAQAAVEVVPTARAPARVLPRKAVMMSSSAIRMSRPRRTGNAPAVLAAVRNIVTTVLRLAGAANIAAARRAAILNPRTAIRLITRTPNPDKGPVTEPWALGRESHK